MMVKVIKENVRMFIAIHWICKRERKALRAFYHEPNLIYIFIQVWVYLWLLRVTSLTHSSQFSMNWCVFFVKRYIIFQHEYRSAAAIFWICFDEMSCTSKTDQLLTFAWKLTPHITKNKKKQNQMETGHAICIWLKEPLVVKHTSTKKLSRKTFCRLK